MNVLTPSGYVDASTLQVGDSVCAFDENTGAPITNSVARVERWQTADGILKSFDLATGDEIGPQFAEWKFYRINGAWTLFCEQSIWRNGTNVCHAKHLVAGDEIYDDADTPVPVTSIEEITADLWYRFDISGDHSYIADGLTLHNANRFCKPGAGTADWTPTNTGIWAATTAGATGQTVPGSADNVTCDANFGGGTCRVNFGGTITIQSITCGAMVGTLDFSVFNNSVTLSSGTAFSGTGTATRTISLGNGTYTLTSTSNNVTIWSMLTTTGLTFSANSSTIDFNGAVAAGIGQSAQGGALTYNAVTVSGTRFDSGLQIINFPIIATLSITAAATVSLLGASTITTLSQTARCILVLPSGSTTTITNAPTLTGTLAAPLAIVNNSTTAIASTATLSCASGTFGGTYVSIEGITFAGGATFSFISSYDLGKNTGATITAPSAGDGLLVNPGMSGGMA